MRRTAPRPLAVALQRMRDDIAPATPLAAIQQAWPGVAGPIVAKEATPVSERGGVVTLACGSAVWAQELDLLAPALLEGLNRALDGIAVRSLRCIATSGGIRP